MMDSEKAVISFLSTELDVAVSGDLPSRASMPRLRVSRLGGSTDIYGWIDKPRIFVESWADTKEVAYNLASDALKALLNNLASAQFDDGVVTFVNPENGLSWSPDNETQKPRYLFSVVLTTHPKE